MTTGETSPSLWIREGVTLLFDQRELERHRCLRVTAGLVRVAVSRLEEDPLKVHPMTLGFLQTGDLLALDLLSKKRLHLQALSVCRLEESGLISPPADGNSLHEWMLEMLLIRDLKDSEHRISALLQLLVRRLGHRRGPWYELNLPMTQAELAELCGHNRGTVSRQFSRWRSQGLLEQHAGARRVLRLAPALMNS